MAGREPGEKFDFPVLFSECRRHDCNIYLLQSFLYVDTLDVVRACGRSTADGCARLQCLVRCCGGSATRAHRALEDMVALRDVVGHCAQSFGVTARELVAPFVRRLDVPATLVSHGGAT